MRDDRRAMRKERRPTQEDMRKAEREIGENLPDAMIGEDTEDVRDVRRRGVPGMGDD